MFTAIQNGSQWAFPLLFAAGVLSSIGPCAAPRILALSSLILRSGHPLRIAAAFLCGTLGVYAVLGFVAGGVMARLSAASTLFYVALALGAFGGGIATIASARWHACANTAPVQEKGSVGMAFAAGAGFSLMVSPCCTPILGVILAISAFRVGPLTIALMLVVFGIGHASTVLVACLAGRPLLTWLPRSQFAQGAQVVAGTLMLAIGAYYALLV